MRNATCWRSKESNDNYCLYHRLGLYSNLATTERYYVRLGTGKRLGWGGNVRDKVLSITLAIAILGSVGILVYSVTNPAVKGKFTEFYLLGLGGEAKDYPAVLTVGTEGKVIVGVVNREQETATYHLEVRLNGVESSEVGPLTLEPEGKWEEVVGFTPRFAGEKQRVEFLLYRQGRSGVYQSLYLWLDVN